MTSIPNPTITFEKYLVSRGKLTQVLPNLKKTNQVPISLLEKITAIVNAWNSNDQITITSLTRGLYHCHVSADAFLYSQNGDVKIEYDSPLLRDVDEALSRDIIKLEEEYYKHSEGPLIKKNVIERYANKLQTQQQVNSNPIWLSIVRNDEKILEEFAKIVFSQPNLEKAMQICSEINPPHYDSLKPLSLAGFSEKRLSGFIYANTPNEFNSHGTVVISKRI